MKTNLKLSLVAGLLLVAAGAALAALQRPLDAHRA